MKIVLVISLLTLNSKCSLEFVKNLVTVNFKVSAVLSYITEL